MIYIYAFFSYALAIYERITALRIYLTQEVQSNLLDFFAFLLVTPEILSKEQLAAIVRKADRMRYIFGATYHSRVYQFFGKYILLLPAFSVFSTVIFLDMRDSVDKFIGYLPTYLGLPSKILALTLGLAITFLSLPCQ